MESEIIREACDPTTFERMQGTRSVFSGTWALARTVTRREWCSTVRFATVSGSSRKTFWLRPRRNSARYEAKNSSVLEEKQNGKSEHVH